MRIAFRRLAGQGIDLTRDRDAPTISAMNYRRAPICALAILAILGGNLAAAREGCCHLGPLAAQCCCHQAVQKAACPKCTAKRSCCAGKEAATDAVVPSAKRPCDCEHQPQAPAVVESTGRVKESSHGIAFHQAVLVATPARTLVRGTVELREPLHPPRHSLAAWQCSWQV